MDLFLMGEVAPSTELLRFCCVWRFTGGGHRSEAEACQFQYDGRWRVYGVCFNAARDRANLLFPYSIDAIPPPDPRGTKSHIYAYAQQTAYTPNRRW